MSDLKLRHLANFASEVEARTLEAALAAQGIVCSLNNAEVVSNFWQLGNAVGGVSVQVAEQDWEAAQAVLGSNFEDGAEWVCSVCHAENEAGFEVCWQCGRECSEPATSPVTIAKQAAVEPAAIPSSTAQETSPLPTERENLQRAWKASVVGFFVPFGFLSVYSLVLLFRLNLDLVPTHERWKFVAAWVLDFTALLFLFLFIRPF